MNDLPKSSVLTSWKEVASYMGKGVRTVQRWEKFNRLPVRRLGGTSKIIVYRDELDSWLRSKAVVQQMPAADLPEQLEVARILRQQNLELRASLRCAVRELVGECKRMATLVSDGRTR